MPPTVSVTSDRSTVELAPVELAPVCNIYSEWKIRHGLLGFFPYSSPPLSSDFRKSAIVNTSMLVKLH